MSQNIFAVSNDVLQTLKMTAEQFTNEVKANNLKNNWKQFKPHWRQIQHQLPNGYRLCPICGDVRQRRFRSHLTSHGITPKQWYDDLMNYKTNPICPCCKKKELKFSDKQFAYQMFCSKKCSNSFSANDRFQKTNEKFGSNFHPESWTDEQIQLRGFSGRDDDRFIACLNKSKTYKKQQRIEYVKIFGDDARPYTWTEQNLRNRGYSGEHDERFLELIKSNELFSRMFKKRTNAKYGKDNKPLLWSDDQIRNRGYNGRDDKRYVLEVLRFLRTSLENLSKGGKANSKKNGSNYTPSKWTDEQLRNRGYSGRDDPKYVKLCDKHLNDCSKAGKENVRKYGFFGAPGSWTDEQILNRGYTGRDDPRYLEKLKQKHEQSVKNGKTAVKMFGCSLDSWGFKINFRYEQMYLKLDSLLELTMVLEILTNMPDEKIIDSQHYYRNTTEEFGGMGALADIRTMNIKTNQITNWEVHNEDDVDRIERKKFCTELHGNVFRLITFDVAKQMKKDLLSRGVISEQVISCIRHSNAVLKVPYEYDYEIEQDKNDDSCDAVASSV